ncbi:MAG: DUF1553 domain-containing protein [Planctomycetaceae bacterium]
MTKWVSSFLLFALAGVIQPLVAAPPPTISEQAAGILVRRCLECHSGADPQGKLDLTSRQNLLRGGDSGPAFDDADQSRSSLWQRVADNEMPPKKPLSEEEKSLLRDWIAAGAPYHVDNLSPWQITTDHRAGLDWWSLRPLRAIAPPSPLDSPSARSPIDAFHQHSLQRADLSASPPAENRVLIRRLTFDLLGLPPAPEEIDEFLADPHPDADERLVDRLLASPHYGERWARHWLDVVRFGESNGFERDLPRPNAWHYRDWVIDALNADLVYPEFVRQQIAGNPRTTDSPDATKSLGFLVAGPHDTVIPASDRMRQAMRFDELEDLLGVVGQTFLGLTVNCARCHDHKFDPVSQTEYYQLAAVLAGIEPGDNEFTSPAVVAELAGLRKRIDRLSKQLQDQESVLRKKILAERNEQIPNGPPPPQPIAAWDFTNSIDDQAGKLPVILHGTAKQSSQGLRFDGGTAYAATPPLPYALREKTLEAKVKLSHLQQQGGGVMSIQSLDGGSFDAIVFGEQEPGCWLAGSDNFTRTQPFQGPVETEVNQEFVILTQAYHADGTIALYRNGRPYGRSYRSNGPVTFEPQQTQVLFGLRHSPPGNSRLLVGTVAAARLYDRALTADEVAATAAAANLLVKEDELLAALSPKQRELRTALRTELESLRTQESELNKTGRIKIFTAVPTQPGPVHLLKRGNVADLGDQVAPAALSAVPAGEQTFRLPIDAPENTRRDALADWLASPHNPLAVRTIVNRLWHYHFGAGFVDSPNDLGFNGGQPQHPDLFEWLCHEFLRTNSSLKQFHRRIVASSVYRQVSNARPEAIAKDASNRQLWRMSPRRLEAEAVRDAMLAAAGELNESLGGPSYQDFNSFFFKGTQFYDPIDVDDANVHRRTVYRMWARSGRSPFLDTFDCPDPSTTTPKRSVTTTPLQALALMNNAFVLRMADRLARRAERDTTSPDSPAAITHVYRLAFGRPPTPVEITAARQFIARQNLPAFCRAILNSSEFLYVE